ncbi:AAA family ATPase [Streptomyces sp. NPDC059002]|uniref:helix-turn-helix transcriptional regulator n=1 Tax=Streptomyces sp. NPDC059002 TaxID=3346690 RepID=UPI0036BB6767
MRLFDRGRELQLLNDALADSVKGSGRLVIVTGGPGSGKSDLVYEFLNSVDDPGIRVLSATALATDQGRPMAVVRQLLDSGKVRCPAVERLPLFRGEGEKNFQQSEKEWHIAVASAVDEATGALLQSAEDDLPWLIAVDDAHLMDGESLQMLLSLLRRIRTSRILVVCVTSGNDSAQATAHTDLMRQPHRRLRLPPLSEQGVAALLAAQAGRLLPSKISRAYHRATAGNPMLVHALIDDSTCAQTEIGQPFASTAYRRAVLHSLTRGGPRHIRVARALAALGDKACATLVGALTGTTPAAVQDVVDVLNSTGLLDGYAFRQPAAAAAVLDDTDPTERRDLHSDVADLLYRCGSPASEVAGHLLLADRVAHSWGRTVLRTAADAALAADDVTLCSRYLCLVLRDCDDERERHALSAALARAEWRVNPAAAGTHLAPLREAALSDALDARDTATVLRHMLWQGDTELAGKAISAMVPSRSRAGTHAIAEVEFIQQWFYGAAIAGRGSDLTRVISQQRRHIPSDNSTALRAKMAVLVGGDATDESVSAVTQALQSHQLDHLNLELVAMALLAIAHTDRTADATRACDELFDCAVRRGARTWQAVLGSVRAELALLQGDVTTAAERAVEALDMLHAQSWGVLVGHPLSTAIFSYTALGRHDAAEELLERDCPEPMFRTVFGLQYLRARGHHYLATDRAFAALDNFETCNRLMRDGNPNLQKGIPWRTDLAQANLRIGKVRTAREWAQQQLRLPGGHSSRARAMALRVLASASKPHQRTSPLREAIDLLKSCGDRLELSLAYADLSAAHSELGEFDRARLVARQAAQEAEACHIESPVDHRLLAPGASVAPAADGSDAVQPLLSDAEYRVAGLAALGYTNREIGSRIHVTISTVEQHLTRVYRKLNVASRADLPSKMLDHRIPTLPDQDHPSSSPAV